MVTEGDDGASGDIEAREPRKETPEEKALRIADEREQLLARILSGAQLDQRQERVAWILNHDPAARNSDITLALEYWRAFDGWDGDLIDPKDLYGFTNWKSLSRDRALIQNEYQLFEADKKVKHLRGKLEERHRGRAIAQKAPPPAFVVYADESSKTSEHVVVASIWFLESSQTVPFTRRLIEWRRRTGFTKEIHFTRLHPDDLDLYKDFVDLVAAHANTISFRAISVPRAGTRNIDELVRDLYYHLLVGGVAREHDTGRARLPRSLRLHKDQETPGADRIMLANIRDKMLDAAHNRFDDGLELDPFSPANSRDVLPIQVADLLAGGLGRVLNTPDGASPKDELAQHILDRFEVRHMLTNEQDIGGMTVHIAL
jgi:hypothetical protein